MINILLPKIQAESRSAHQRIFNQYNLLILINLTVLSLFNEHWDYVLIDSFTICLLAAVLLQVMLQVAVNLSRHVSDYFKSKSGTLARVMMVLSTWILLIISKLIILKVIDIAFGSHVSFTGPLHGIVIFITVVIVILAVEQLFIRIYNALA